MAKQFAFFVSAVQTRSASDSKESSEIIMQYNHSCCASSILQPHVQLHGADDPMIVGCDGLDAKSLSEGYQTYVAVLSNLLPG